MKSTLLAPNLTCNIHMYVAMLLQQQPAIVNEEVNEMQTRRKIERKKKCHAKIFFFHFMQFLVQHCVCLFRKITKKKDAGFLNCCGILAKFFFCFFSLFCYQPAPSPFPIDYFFFLLIFSVTFGGLARPFEFVLKQVDNRKHIEFSAAFFFVVVDF